MPTVTADTLTDEQIRALHDWASEQPNRRRLERSCTVALYGATAEDLRRGETREIARTRCAEAINARAKETP